MSNKTFPDITGRDWFVVGQALAYAVATIDALPEVKRDPGLRADMAAVFNNLFAAEDLRRAILIEVESALGRPSTITEQHLPRLQ